MKPKQQTLPFGTSDWNKIGKPTASPSTRVAGANRWNPNLSGFQFHFKEGTPGAGYDPHAVSAVGPTGEAHGLIQWHPSHGEVQLVEVHDAMKGTGIAAAMWDRAHAISQGARPQPPMQGQQKLPMSGIPNTKRIVPPRHSSQRTEEGNAWAQKMGGHLPPWQKVRLYGGAEN